MSESYSVRRIDSTTAGLEGGGRWSGDKEGRQPLKGEKDKKMLSPLETPAPGEKGTQACQHPDFSSVRLCLTADLQHRKVIRYVVLCH